MGSSVLARVGASVRRHGLSKFIRVALRDHLVLPLASRILSTSGCNAMETFLHLGYWPSLRNPQTFNEKLLWRKLHDDNPLYPMVTDKHRVREYVAERVGEQVLTKLLHVTDNPATIPFDSLPRSFVVKANFGAGRNIMVRDKDSMDRDEVVSRCRSWLVERGNSRLGRWKYHDMPRRILVEEMLDCGDGEFLVDYKFYVFHGRTRMIEVTADGDGKSWRNLYDEQGRVLDVVWNGIPVRKKEFEFPVGFDEMQRAAEALGADFDFVSVDFYLVRDAWKFAELSLFPDGGLGRFEPRSFDRELGSWWKLAAGSKSGSEEYCTLVS